MIIFSLLENFNKSATKAQRHQEKQIIFSCALRFFSLCLSILMAKSREAKSYRRPPEAVRYIKIKSIGTITIQRLSNLMPGSVSDVNLLTLGT